MIRAGLLVLLLCILRCAAGAGAQDLPSGAGLAAALRSATSGLCPTPCMPVDTAGLGNFFWFYQNIDGVFNQGTLDMIDTRVMPGALPGVVRLSAAGGFLNAYVQVAARLTYALGSADLQRVQATAQTAAVAAASVVGTAETVLGPITPAAMDQARKVCGSVAIAGKLDYVITYLMGSVWSGRGAHGLPPLTIDAMTASPDLLSVLPETPANGKAVVTAAVVYLQAAQAVSAIWAQVQLASWRIDRMNRHAGYPTTGNGGMATVSPWTGVTGPGNQPGYRIARTLAALSADLYDPARVVRVPMHVADENGQPRDYVLELTGYTYVPIVPYALQDDGSGWYANDPIAAAVTNGMQDVTGYRFVYPTGYNLGGAAQGGDFGRLTGLLVCQDLRVLPALHPPPGRGAAVFAHLWTAISGPYRSKASAPNVPMLEQQAYVVGVTVAYPVETGR